VPSGERLHGSNIRRARNPALGKIELQADIEMDTLDPAIEAESVMQSSDSCDVLLVPLEMTFDGRTFR
jgi:hypothetical protein